MPCGHRGMTRVVSEKLPHLSSRMDAPRRRGASPGPIISVWSKIALKSRVCFRANSVFMGPGSPACFRRLSGRDDKCCGLATPFDPTPDFRHPFPMSQTPDTPTSRETKTVQAMHAPDTQTGAVIPPIHPSTTYLRGAENELVGPTDYRLSLIHI